VGPGSPLRVAKVTLWLYAAGALLFLAWLQTAGRGLTWGITATVLLPLVALSFLHDWVMRRAAPPGEVDQPAERTRSRGKDDWWRFWLLWTAAMFPPIGAAASLGFLAWGPSSLHRTARMTLGLSLLVTSGALLLYLLT